MSRYRPAFVCVCIAIVLSAALPAAGAASRNSEQTRAEDSGSPAGGLADSVRTWSLGAWAWLQAIIAEEHGTIIPLVPPPPPAPPPPPPSDLDPWP